MVRLPIAASQERRVSYCALSPAEAHERKDLVQGWGPRQRALRAQRRSIFEAITSKAPITIEVPIALTHLGWKRPCSSRMSGCGRR